MPLLDDGIPPLSITEYEQGTKQLSDSGEIDKSQWIASNYGLKGTIATELSARAHNEHRTKPIKAIDQNKLKKYSTTPGLSLNEICEDVDLTKELDADYH